MKRLGGKIPLVRTFIGALLVFAFFYYLWDRREELSDLLTISAFDIFLLCALIVVTWVVNGCQSYVLYRAAGMHVTIPECVVLSLAGTFGNYLPMRLGTILRAQYLKKNHDCRYASFGGLASLRLMLSIMAAGVFGASTLLYLYMQQPGTPVYQLLFIFMSLIIVPLCLVLLPVPEFKWLPEKLVSIWSGFREGFISLRQKPTLVSIILLLVMLQYLVMGLRFAVSADALGLGVSMSVIMLVAPLATLMGLMSITPGGIGLREAVMGFVTLSIGAAFSQGFFIGSIDRLILLAMISVFGTVSFFFIWKKI